jgi:arylsulfatase
MKFLTILIGASMIMGLGTSSLSAKIVHDAEYYVLEAQHGEKWAAEDVELDTRLAALRKKHGGPPNIVYVLWDDVAFGDIGIPAIQKVRGFETPHLNKLASEGILFTRMYTEVGCTPSRAAVMTGRNPIRNGMFNIGMLRESHGLRDSEVTIAEILSKAGYATAHHGKWHLGDIEESYPHKQGFDESFFSPYNQVSSSYTRAAEAANASIGLHEDMLPPDPYKLDNTFVTKGWAMFLEGEKGGKPYNGGTIQLRPMGNSMLNLNVGRWTSSSGAQMQANRFSFSTTPWFSCRPLSTQRSIHKPAACCRMDSRTLSTPLSANSWRSSMS